MPIFPNHGILNQGHQCASGEIHIINCIDEFGMSWLNVNILLFAIETFEMLFCTRVGSFIHILHTVFSVLPVLFTGT